MKRFLIWAGGAAVIFLVALALFRGTLSSPAAGSGRGESASAGASGLASTQPGAKPGKSTRGPDRAGSGAGKTETIRVPPGFVELISIVAFDPDTGEFTPELRELLDLSAKELAALKSVFDDYFKAHSEAEVATAKVLEGEERPRLSRSDVEEILTIRIDPMGERMAADLSTMRSRLVDRLGRTRGLTAAAMISRQLGNNGKGGEIVSFLKHPQQDKYSLQVKGLKQHALRAGTFGSAAIYDEPDFSLLVRYRHLAGLGGK